MNRTNLILCLLIGCPQGLLFAASAGGAAADQEPPPPPTPPYVQKMPDWCSWTVTYKSKHAVAATGKTPAGTDDRLDPIKQIDVTKAGDVRRDLELDETNTTLDRWTVKGVEMYLYPGSATSIVVVNAATDGNALNFHNADFGGMPDLSLQNYVDAVKFGGTECYHFFLKHTRPEGDTMTINAAERAETHNREIWIDVKTKLPVAFDDGESIRLYTFSPQRPAPLTLPANFAAELQHYQEVAKEPSRHSAIR